VSKARFTDISCTTIETGSVGSHKFSNKVEVTLCSQDTQVALRFT